MPIASPDDVLTFWFAPGQSDRWYAKDEAFDAEIRQRFLPTYEAACSGHLDAWREGPDSLLALSPRALDSKQIMRSNNGRRFKRNRKFVDSPLEGAVTSELVSEVKSRSSQKSGFQRVFG